MIKGSFLTAASLVPKNYIVFFYKNNIFFLVFKVFVLAFKIKEFKTRNYFELGMFGCYGIKLDWF